MNKDYEMLVEDYEDALMRLVAYRAAQADGKRLLEEAEALERSGFQVPPELDEKCMKIIARAPEERGQAPIPDGGRLGIRQVARLLVVAILTATILFCAAIAGSDDFRVKVLNYTLEIQDNAMQFFFRSDGTSNLVPLRPEKFPFQFTYIPEGYDPIRHEVRDMGGELDFFHAYRLRGNENNFYFRIGAISEGTGIHVGTGGGEVTEVMVHGCPGWLVRATDSANGWEDVRYLWFDLENGWQFDYFSYGLPFEESQKVFEGLVIDTLRLQTY